MEIPPAQTSSPKTRRYLLTYYAVMITVGLMAGILGPVLPGLARATHSTLGAISLILALRPAGYLLGTLSAGHLLDRRPGHPILASALLLAALSLVLVPFTSSLQTLSLLILLMGFADGNLDVGSNTLLPWVYGRRVGPYLNGMHFSFGIGALSAPLLVAQTLSFSGNIRASFWIIGLCMLPATAALFFISSPTRLQPENSAASPVKTDLKLTLLLIFIFLAYGGAETAMGAWIYSYAIQFKLGNPEHAAYLTSLFWGMLTLGRLIGIPLALRIPLPKILRVDAIGSVCCLAWIVMEPHSSTVLWLGTAGAGLFMASFFPTLLAYASGRLSPQGRLSGSLTSLFFVGSSTGSIVLPWAIGQGFSPLGPRVATCLILASLSLMGLLLVPLFWKPLALPGA